MNGVSYEDIRRTLGPSGFQELEHLHDWLYGPVGLEEKSRNWTGRKAPSIITRGEAELFSLSMPRFALRVYMGGSEGSFVNCRRIGEFCDQSRKWGKRHSRNELGAGRRNDIGVRHLARIRRPAWTLRKNSCIADCLLGLPSGVDRWKGLTNITVALGRAYGESHDLVGTPYVRQIKLSGGGLCAQAACFMAAALLHDHTMGVWGVAEVTALSSPSASGLSTGPLDCDAREYVLEGLTQEGIVDYFLSDYVKLNAVWMQSLPASFTNKVILREQSKPLACAMKAYIASSCPIILPLDMGRMAGIQSPKSPLLCKSIYEQNGLDAEMFLADPNEARARRHAVVVVGYGSDDWGSDIFLLNDPASRPFLKADAGQIGQSSFYTSDDLSNVMWGRFLAVTPEKVKLPLVSWRPRYELNRSEPYPGLLRLASVLQCGLYSMPGMNLPVCRSQETESRFRLSEVAKIVTGPLDSAALKDLACEGLQKCKEELIGRFGPRHWCWTQVTDNSIWAWNAEMALPAEDDVSPQFARKYLMSVWQLGKAGWQRVYASDEQLTKDNSAPATTTATTSPVRSEVQPRKSLISSFTTAGFNDAMANWPAGVKYGDIYCFMQDDAERYLPAKTFRLRVATMNQNLRWVKVAKLWDWPRFLGWQVFTNRRRRQGRLRSLEIRKRPATPIGVWPAPITTAMDRLSAHTRRKGRIQDVCTWIDRLAQAKGVSLLAMATYFPEVQATGAKGRRVTRALRFLIDVCSGLQDSEHPINTIEIVAGGLISSVWPAKWQTTRKSSAETPPTILDSKQDLYAATSLNTSQALKRLLGRLRPLREHAINANIQFSIELEPGPLYVLRNWESLIMLCDLLETEPDKGGFKDISKIVGLNLDCSHYTMSQITSKMVLEESRVRDRIVHIHVADHGRGHFGDVALGRIHKDEHFEDWLRVFPELLKKRDEHLPTFRGGVSIEIEACQNSKHMAESVATLERVVASL